MVFLILCMQKHATAPMDFSISLQSHSVLSRQEGGTSFTASLADQLQDAQGARTGASRFIRKKGIPSENPSNLANFGFSGQINT